MKSRKGKGDHGQGSLFGDIPDRAPAGSAANRPQPAAGTRTGDPDHAALPGNRPGRDSRVRAGSAPAGSTRRERAAERQVLTVSRLNREGRALLESSFRTIWVEGEVSNFSAPSSGHWYFTLKDANAQVRCAMFRNERLRIRLQARDGMEVLIRGRVTLYEARGEFQIVAEHMEETGEGRLRAAFDALKQRLAAEGLFDQQRKQALPAFPRRIGILTSPTGAAVRDILNVLRRRFPAIPVRIYPIPVQGAEAAPRIVQALRLAGRRADCDLLILGRGGGSLEDLWAFNEEIVARAIGNCRIPIISAVGHEVDFTIADFVADQRAPTPSAAAELAVPEQTQVSAGFAAALQRLAGLMRARLQRDEERLSFLRRRLQQQHPGARLQQHMQRLDELTQRMEHAAQLSLAHWRRRFEQARARLRARSPDRLLPNLRERSRTLDSRLHNMIRQTLDSATQRLANLSRALHAVSPLATLARGYAIVSTAEGGIARDASRLVPGDQIEARLARGRVLATVERSLEDDADDAGSLPSGTERE